MDIKTTFKRYELKYLIDKKQKEIIVNAMKEDFQLDNFGISTIRNIYFDTSDYRIIRYCLDKPIYKEKLRIRSYNNIASDDTIFIELKKKYQSVVYKRRLAISAKEIYYCFKNKLDINDNSQIAKEINYYRKFYADLRPAMFISYQRAAYCQKNDDMRITFDCDIKYRNNSFSLNNTNGINILDNNQFLMEIKTSKSIPLHLARIFSQLNIIKTSFSKYGSAYYQMINQKEVNKC